MKSIAWACALSATVLGPFGPGSTRAAEAGVTRMDFGKTPDGQAVELYTISNGGMTVKVMTYGAIITSIEVPDKAGKTGEVTLGFDSLDGYLKGHPYFGATVGRVANRVAKGTFTLDGKTYKLAVNNGPNALHGGLKGFDKVIWKAVPTKVDGDPAVKMSYRSPDGEEGYPGVLEAEVTFSVSKDNTLQISYLAESGAPTPVNLTNHAYFNLSGPGSGTILDHVLKLEADEYTPVDDTLIPTGEIAKVAGTPLDFAKATAIGERIKQIKADPVGYDHNFVLRRPSNERLPVAAEVYDPASGRVLTMRTTEPGVQFYSGNFLDGTVAGKGGAYPQYGGFCLEAQHFPDSVNQPKFPPVILRPGQTYRQTTTYQFSTR